MLAAIMYFDRDAWTSSGKCEHDSCVMPQGNFFSLSPTTVI